MRRPPLRRWSARCLALLALCLAGCAGVGSNLVDIPFLSVSVKAVDEADQPIAGAVVESSRGQQATTDGQGVASVSLGALGVSTLTVTAEGRAPAVLSVTMPTDRGKTLTARLGRAVQVEIPSSSRAAPAAGLALGAQGLLGGLLGGQIYPMLFQSLFATHGYSMDLGAYEPGQWTEWQMRSGDGDRPMVMRKAFLARLENGQEWWQIRLPGEAKDEAMVMEVLFSKGRDSLRRMRQKMGDGEAREVPVAEGWYSRPTELTPESREGAVKQRGVTVKVPAGSFQADLLEFSDMAGGAVRMWRAAGVPGGVVRSEVAEAGRTVAWQSELTGHGAGAKTELGSY